MRTSLVVTTILGFALLAAAGLAFAQERPESSTPNPATTTPTSVSPGAPTPFAQPTQTEVQPGATPATTPTDPGVPVPEQLQHAPTIENVRPNVATPWSYIVVSGRHLTSDDGSCSLDIDGQRAYIAACSPFEIRAVVPWTADRGVWLQRRTATQATRTRYR